MRPTRGHGPRSALPWGAGPLRAFGGLVGCSLATSVFREPGLCEGEKPEHQLPGAVFAMFFVHKFCLWLLLWAETEEVICSNVHSIRVLRKPLLLNPQPD